MNKEEYAIDGKTYENYDGLKIKIIFSNLGRRYKKTGDNLSLMLEKETVKLEDSLTAMIRITKENEEIDRKMEIEKIKQQEKKEVQQLEEVKNTKIIELEKELAILKEMYEIKQREKEQKTKLANELIKFKEKLQLEDEIEEKGENSQDNLPEIRIDEINDDDLEQHSETSETYTEILANIDNTRNLEINIENVDIDEKPSTSGVKNPKNFNPKYYNENYGQYDREKTIWDKRLNKKWTPKPITGKHEFLDLDCVADINKIIQLWMGYISK